MTAILYGAATQLTPLHRMVQATRRSTKVATGLEPIALDEQGNAPVVWVRMELSDWGIVKALDYAKPMLGEIVLNTMDL